MCQIGKTHGFPCTTWCRQSRRARHARWLASTGESRRRAAPPRDCESRQALGDGTSVRDIARQVPFVRLYRLALAAEEGPERIVAEQWRHMREQAQKMDWPEWKLLIEAAYREPKLRPLYPYMRTDKPWPHELTLTTRPPHRTRTHPGLQLATPLERHGRARSAAVPRSCSASDQPGSLGAASIPHPYAGG